MAPSSRVSGRGRQRALALLLAPALAGAALGCSPSAPAAGPAPAGEGLVVVQSPHPEHPEEIDLGHLALGDIARHTVRLRNGSGAPITIRSIQAGCTCTQPSISYVDPGSGELVRGDPKARGRTLVVPPGVTADLLLTVDTTLAVARNQYKLVLVRLTTDSPATPFLSLSVRLFVESPFRPAPAVIDLRHVAEHGGAAGEIALAPDGLGGQRITGVLASPAEIAAELGEQPVGGVDLWVVRVQLLPPVPLGFREHVLKLATTGPGGRGEGPPLEVKVRATGVADAAIDPPLVPLDRPADGSLPQVQALLISRLSGHGLRVLAARAEGLEPGRIEVEVAPRAPDADGRAAVWELTLRATADLGPAELRGALVAETDDAQLPRVEATWVWRP